MSAGTTHPKQKFRCRSTGAILAIATHLDPDTGERVVLWEEIQAGFKDADSVRDEDSLVSFLRDTTLKEIIPRRIAYHPGTVLDVIVDDHHHRDYGHSHSYSLSNNQLDTKATLPDVAPTQDFCQSSPRVQSTARHTDVATTAILPASVTLVDSDADNRSLVPYSPAMDGSLASSVVVSNPPSLQDVVSNQVAMQLSLNQQIEGLQKQLAQLQQDSNRKLDKAAEERARNQEEMKELQRKQQETADQL
ncbi:hypothetical protein BGX31_002289, partial [Mortierella sp. GBA43]